MVKLCLHCWSFRDILTRPIVPERRYVRAREIESGLFKPMSDGRLQLQETIIMNSSASIALHFSEGDDQDVTWTDLQGNVLSSAEIDILKGSRRPGLA